MFFSVKVYRQACPDCGCEWAQQLSSRQDVIRIGKEAYVCKCPKTWTTGRIEWNHLSRERRRLYFFSEAEIGVLAICTLVPPLFGYFISDGWRGAMKAGSWGF